MLLLCLLFRARIEQFINAADPEKEKNIVFGGCNAFQRKLIYQIVEKGFNDKVTATSQVKNNQKVLVIERKWSPERQLADVEKRNAEDENEYLRLVGLSAVLLKISQSVCIALIQLQINQYSVIYPTNFVCKSKIFSRKN